MTIKNKILSALVATMAFSGSAIAGELGVTNSYGHSFRYGTGTTNIQFTTTSQLTENSTAGAIKIETSTFNQNSAGANNGFGNGDQGAPGNSGNANNAENANAGSGTLQDLVGSFSDRAFAASINYGTRNYTENTTANGTTNDQYTFGSTNFTHSVGTFSR